MTDRAHCQRQVHFFSFQYFCFIQLYNYGFFGYARAFCYDHDKMLCFLSQFGKLGVLELHCVGHSVRRSVCHTLLAR